VVGQITRATDRANRLIADLLDFTQARVGTGLAVTTGSMDLHDVVTEALDELRLAHPSRAIVHTRTGAGACVADANRLVQLVGNLVSNAVAYGRPDVDITVSTSIEGATCSLAVHNAGSAIPDEQRASLFEPMTRGTKSGGKSRSVGLGLFIVREIARAHGGEVAVQSSTDDGTTFRVSFPAARS
jgi:sigma-B regulation protein RsbU (phosphoserine phosphatase)